MKILFVNEKCGYFGGVEQNVAATARGLRAMGHYCGLAYGARTEKKFEEYAAIFEETFPCAEIIGGESSGSQPFDEIVRAAAPDVLYIHKAPSIRPLLPYVGKIRTVRYVHDHDLCCPRRHKYFLHNNRVCMYPAGWRCWLDLAFLESKEGLRFVSIPARLREMRLNYGLDLILTGSRFMRDELLVNGFDKAKVRILPPMTPLRPVTPSPAPDEPVILCVAQLIKGKGVDLLLHALSKVGADFRAVIVGTGNLDEELKSLARSLGLWDKVQFEGWLPNEAVGAFYTRAKIVAVPCRWAEPFGMIGLEAMNHGRPVVAFNVGGIPDWLAHEETGLLAPEQNIAAFAQALERLLKDADAARRMGENALARALTQFSFEDYLQRCVQYLTG